MFAFVLFYSRAWLHWALRLAGRESAAPCRSPRPPSPSESAAERCASPPTPARGSAFFRAPRAADGACGEPHRAFVNRAAMRLGLRLQSLVRYCVARRRHSVPGPAKRRRNADPPAGAFLTGLATADWPSLRCGTDALFCLGPNGSALARARVKSRKIRDRPGRSPRPSARTAPNALTTAIRLCRPGDPPPRPAALALATPVSPTGRGV